MGADTGKVEPKEAAFALNNRVLRMPDLSEAEVTDEGGGRGSVVGWGGGEGGGGGERERGTARGEDTGETAEERRETWETALWAATGEGAGLAEKSKGGWSLNEEPK